jgi:lipopolysaccharide export system protein LptA
MKQEIILLILLFFLLSFAKSSDLILKSANSNINTMGKDGEIISVLSGNVVFLYEDAVIKSQNAKWWKSRGTVTFTDNVIIQRQAQTLFSDRMDYDKNKKSLTAEGKIDFWDAKEKVKLTGKKGVYNIDSHLLTIEGNPCFYFFDTLAKDTLKISSKKMTYNDSLKIASVFGDVLITKGKLFTKSNIAHYYVDSGWVYLRELPNVAYDTDSIRGDSVDVLFVEKRMKLAKVKGKSVGQYKNYGQTDTSITHLIGDSLCIFFTDSGKTDSMWVIGNVISRYIPIKKPYLESQAFGKQMTVSFDEKGDVSFVKIWGNAKSIYNLEEKDGRGINDASGDTIIVLFTNGKVSKVRLSGSVRGYYAPLPQFVASSLENTKTAKKNNLLKEK